MSVEFNHQDYTTGKQILMFPDHYVALAHKFNKQDSVAVQENGRYIVKAGTIYPANDQTAIGVVLNDYDVTKGDITGAIVVHGFIQTAKIPKVPTSNAKGALKQITFFPLTAVTVALTGTKLSVSAGEASGTEHDIVVSLTGASFRPEASTLSNWTFTGEATTKMAVESVTISGDGKMATIHTKNNAEAAAGDLKAKPKAASISTGDVPAQDFVLATVS